MHRRSMRAALVLVVATTLTLAACGAKNQSGSGGDSTTTPPANTTTGSTTTGGTTTGGTTDTGNAGALAIVPQLQIDVNGTEVKEQSGGTPADPADGGGHKCSGVNLAFAGAMTGANAALGLNILYGARVAIDKHNKANPDCQVQIKPFDTEGDPQKATQVAPQIISDASVIGMLGPAFSGETKATGGTFAQAGLLTLTASATNPDLAKNGWKTFFRGLANDAVQGPADGKYMVNTLGFKKVCVVQDNSDYGVGLAKEVTAGLGSAADSACAAKVKGGDKDFSATVSLVTAEKPDAVFYAGYYAEAAPFVSQLRSGGFTGVFMSADGTNDPQFVKQAGAASKDAILSCPCGPAPEAFAAEYKALNNAEPGVYSTEGYDLTTIMLKAIDSGVKDRAGMVDYVKNYDGYGLARQYKWNDQGELSAALIWIYKVQ